MKLQTNQFIADPGLFDALSLIELTIRMRLSGAYGGAHPSRLRGGSIEFAEHKEYTPGDDIRYIDWKAYAKFDKYYVKRFVTETDLKALLLLDQSESMLYRSGPVNKLVYASYMAAAIAFILLRQRDNVGLALFKETIEQYIPPRNLTTHCSLIFNTLSAAVASGKTDIYRVLMEVSDLRKARSFILIFSDFLNSGEQWIYLLKQLKKRHDLVIFHILDPAEQEFPFKDYIRFKFLEKGQELLVNAKELRKGYIKAVADFIDRFRQGLNSEGIEYYLVNTAADLEDSLFQFFQYRKA